MGHRPPTEWNHAQAMRFGAVSSQGEFNRSISFTPISPGFTERESTSGSGVSQGRSSDGAGHDPWRSLAKLSPQCYDFTQDQVAIMLSVSVERVRTIERSPVVDAVTAEKYERAVAYLRGRLRQMARRVARAAREAAAV